VSINRSIDESGQRIQSETIVSVIVPTLNCGKVIERCLRSIANQTHKRTEILVVDGGSIDCTVDIARKFGCRTIKARANTSHQRNLGTLNAKSDLILYLDSDEVLHPRLIEECVQKATIGKYDAMFVSTIDTGTTYFGKSRCLGDILSVTMRRELRLPNAKIRFCNRRVFKSVGGYDEDLIVGEDILFGLKCISQGFRLGRCKNPILHFGTEGLGRILVKKYLYFKSLRIFSEKAERLGVSFRKEHIFAGLFYVRHLYELRTYCARYIFGYVTVKIVETAGSLLGYYSSRFEGSTRRT
jgi:glycosyltransferase involved in cell wall biosynthesis